MSEKAKKEMDGPTSALVLIGLIACQFVDAWTVMLLWRWFVVPLGAPAIGMGHAYGLAILVGFLCKSPHMAKKDEDPLNVVGREWGWTLLVLTLGFAVHSLGMPR